MTYQKERSIGFVTESLFYSDQHNERFHDVAGDHTIKEMKFKTSKKGSNFEVILNEGVHIDHRGIRYDFLYAEPLVVTFPQNFPKKYMRLSVFYEKVEKPTYDKRRNFDMELRAYPINDFKEVSGTHKGETYHQFHVATFENKGGNLVMVDRPFMLGEEVQIQIRELHERITKEVNRLDQKIDTVERTLTEKINTVEQKLTQKINSVENSLNQKINNLETNINQEINNINNNINDIGDDLQNTNDTASEAEKAANRSKIGMKRTKKDPQGTFEVVEYYDQDGKLMSKSVLSQPNGDGLYQRRTVTLAMGTPKQKVYNTKLTYDADGDLILEEKQ